MRKTRLNKKSKKRSPEQIARDKAWAVFSKYIREVRDKNICYTCGDTTQPKNAGHFWHNVLDFDEENIHCQCIVCNKWKSGNLAVYSVKLLNDLGEERFKALDQRHTMAMKGDKKDLKYYEDIIEKYSKLLAE